jgi:phage major head subunit gpT-like protein
MIIDASNLTALRDSINTRFQTGFNAAGARVWWNRLAMEVPSGSETNTYAWMEDLPRFREWVGERVAHDLSSRAAVVSNKDFELTVKIPANKIKDDQYGIYGTYAESGGVQGRKLPDDLLTPLIKLGKSTVCYDGQYFFDTDHPVDPGDPASAVQANLFTAKPLATAGNYGAVRAAMRSLKIGRSARVIGVTPSLLIVGPDLEETAKKIVTAENDASGATNVNRGTAEVVVIEELDEAGVWYLADATGPLRPLVWQNREAVHFDGMFNPTDEHVFKFNEFLWGGSGRGNAAYGLWFLMCRVEPT